MFIRVKILHLLVAAEIHRAVQMKVFAMKNTYGCNGVSPRQHNEPAGNQDVLHYHLHVYPRYENDNLYLAKGTYTESDERPFYSEKLRSGIEGFLANQE